MNNVRKYCSSIKKWILRERLYIYISILFLLMDFLVRLQGHKLSFSVFDIRPTLFTLSWIVLFVGLIACLKGIGGKILYWILFTTFLILAVTHSVYLGLTNYYFSFHLILLAEEGSSYIWDTIKNANPLIYLVALIFIVLAYFISKKIPKQDKFDVKKFITIIIIFFVTHITSILALGPANDNLKWNSFNKPKNIYNSYSDSNKSLKISGLYEYSFRSFYVTFLKPEEKIRKEDKEFLNNVYNNSIANVENNYTGIFEGKNIILLQLEGIDDWVFNKKDMPNLYSLLKNSIYFTDHYSMYTGGGSTFNSEFSVNTGFTTPLSYIANVYNFNTNTFKTTLPKEFKKRGYSTNAFHMNSGDFYSRAVNYKSWGYDNYYGLADIKDYKNLENTLDRELILNKTFYDKMFKQKGPFLHYIITYSPHTPFTTESDVGKLLAEEKYGNDIPKMTEEECVKLSVRETDYMVELLIQALKDNGLYDNTVIVAFSDHYLYTLEDKSILKKYKDTDSNLINHTPFFIWSSDLEKQSINKTTMQTNVLPTILNLFGFDYNTNEFIGKDALSNEYEGYAFFSDYSWYNGKVYVMGEDVYVMDKKSKTDRSIPKRKINKISEEISNKIRQNDLTLRYNYFKNNK